ncbi:MAG: N-6 DNA methylase [Chlorobi bacterium]|nr:N-6 DNA methylase [Chlorobiota bacterium]
MSAGRTVNSSSQHWGTPKKYVDVIRRFFDGAIDLDPCSNQYSIVNANLEYHLPYQDGLRESWNYSRIFVNPPYGADRERGTTIKHWLYRCADAHWRYSSEVVALVPVATNTRHWKQYVWGRATAIAFLYDTRLKFLVNGNDGGKGAPMSCAIVYWGKQYRKFHDLFIQYGAVVDIRNLHQQSIGPLKEIPQLSLMEQLS